MHCIFFDELVHPDLAFYRSVLACLPNLYFLYDFFLLDYNKIHKIQTFSALDIVESHSKEMWLVSY